MFSFLWITTLDPGGTSGIRLKSCTRYKYMYVDMFGLHFAVISIFNVIFACSIKWSHSEIENCGSQVAKSAKYGP